MDKTAPERQELLALTAQIVSAHLSHNLTASSDLQSLIESVHGKLSHLGEPEALAEEPAIPAVPIRKSVQDDHIICLEDGKKLKMLKRHLTNSYGMTPEEYRAKWGLPYDYPMVAPAYSRVRQELAKKIGLGRKPAEQAPARKSRKKAS